MSRFIFIITSLLSTISVLAEPINEMCPVTPEEPAEAWLTTEYLGETIGFCCKSCLRKFSANPEAYIENVKSASSSQAQVLHTDQGVRNGNTIRSDHSHEHLDEGVSAGSKDSQEHDHATDHRTGDGSPITLLVLLGKLHVIVVHLPIALLPLAGLLEGIGIFRKSPKWLFAARTNFLIGAIVAIVAAILGWLAADHSSYSGELTNILFLHRWLGTTVAAISALGLIFLICANRGHSLSQKMYRFLSFVLIFLVPSTAHFGGSLIYGVNYPF